MASNLYLCVVNLIHIFLVAPLLIYIGYQQELTPTLLYQVLMVLGVLVLGYHLFMVFSTDRCFKL